MSKYIGNVVVTNVSTKVDVLFKKCLSMSEIDKSLPTLVIGLENAKRNISGFNILERCDGNLWWTYSRMERRSVFNEDTEKFFEYCLNKIFDCVEYEYVNILELGYSRSKEMIKLIKGDEHKIIYFDRNEFVFVYFPLRNKVYGFSLTTTRYCGINSDKIREMAQENAQYNRVLKNFFNIPNKIRRSIDGQFHKLLIISTYFSQYP